MPYCRDCGIEFYSRNVYCDICEQDIINRSKDQIASASVAERQRMKNDKNYAHSWLQDTIGWVVDLIKIINKIWTGGCFVTSALVKHKGLSDNCIQMQKFRSFRQNHILKNKNNDCLKDLENYYFEGQILVSWIESREDCNLIWKYVEDYIKEFTQMLDNKDYDSAYNYFKFRTFELQNDIFWDKHTSKKY